MDEPTNHLDIPSCEVLEDGLNKYEGTLVLITHDRRLMNEVCTGILEIQGGTAEYYLGNYDDYRDKKNGLTPDFSDGDGESTRTFIETTAPDGVRQSKKERKRREAQARLILFRKQAPLKEEIQDLEKRIAEKEERKREIEELLSDSSLYNRKEDLRVLLAEAPSLEADISSLEARWEELQASLEEMERSLAEYS
jgi:ATP-binding cassette subfamily F protein 3